MTVATDKRKVSAYLPDDLKEDADKLAEAESRSLSNLIEVLLKQAVEKAKAEGRIK
jgi:predicted transcriptional regulator